MFLIKLIRNDLIRKSTPLFFSNARMFATKHEEHQIQIDGQTINYVITGAGTHPVLCMPGALGTIFSDFDPQLQELDQTKFRIIAWDPPGYGKSRPPTRAFGADFYERDADMAFKLMKSLSYPKFSILGWSDGGISGMIVAGKYPDNVRKLVVWGANAYVGEKDIEAYEAIKDLSKWSPKMVEPLSKMYGNVALQQMWNDWCDTLKDIHDKNRGDICKNMLENIRCPTFILHGDKDPLVPQEHPMYLAKNILPSKVHRFPDGKHNIHLRYSKEFNRLVNEFLSTQHSLK